MVSTLPFPRLRSGETCLLFYDMKWARGTLARLVARENAADESRRTTATRYPPPTIIRMSVLSLSY